jgi:hypothetical protein
MLYESTKNDCAILSVWITGAIIQKMVFKRRFIMTQLVFDAMMLIINIVLIVLIAYVFYRVVRWLVKHK